MNIWTNFAAVMIGFCLLCAVWIFLTETLRGYRLGNNRAGLLTYLRWWRR